MSTTTLHRTGTQSYETRIDGQRWSVNALGTTWYVVRDGEIVAETDGFREARDYVETTVTAEQNAAQDATEGHVACYNIECLAATGPVCTCGCGGAGHGMVYTGTMLKF